MSTPTKKLSPQEQLAEVRRLRKKEYYQDKTPEEAKKKGEVYLEKKVIEKEIYKEDNRIDLDTSKIVAEQIEKDRRDAAVFAEKLKVQAALDKKQRELEEIERGHKLEQIRIKKAEQAKLEAEEVQKRAHIPRNSKRDTADDLL
jgi:hypothetical protein